MIELKNDALVFSFPEVHPEARLRVVFQRTLRIPDDESSYALPPGLGPFPLRHVDDFAANVPTDWVAHGGVMLPMYQSEAMWLRFGAGDDAGYPFAVKVATGKVNAATGRNWSDGLHDTPQDYLTVPRQPWLDGYCVEKGVIRQFVAMPLGAGYSAEEQLTGEAEHGGLQIIVYPMKRDVFERRLQLAARMREITGTLLEKRACLRSAKASSMGLSPGGRMRQEIYEDPYGIRDWDSSTSSRCFVHIANSLIWRSITGDEPPTVPPTAAEYTRAGLPWFDYYDEAATALSGSDTLGKMKSVATLGKEKTDVPLPENEAVSPERVVVLRKGLAKDQVREGAF